MHKKLYRTKFNRYTNFRKNSWFDKFRVKWTGLARFITALSKKEHTISWKNIKDIFINLHRKDKSGLWFLGLSWELCYTILELLKPQKVTEKFHWPWKWRISCKDDLVEWVLTETTIRSLISPDAWVEVNVNTVCCLKFTGNL